MISFICGAQNIIQMNLFTKQKQAQIQRTNLWLPKGKVGWCGRDKLGVWDWQMPATVYKIDEQGAPGNREVYSISSNKLQWKRKSQGARV